MIGKLRCIRIYRFFLFYLFIKQNASSNKITNKQDFSMILANGYNTLKKNLLFIKMFALFFLSDIYMHKYVYRIYNILYIQYIFNLKPKRQFLSALNAF